MALLARSGLSLLICAFVTACVSLGLQSKKIGHPVTPAVRQASIQRAQVWTPTPVRTMDIMAGPPGPGAFAPNETVSCQYISKTLGGRSPKFACLIPPRDELKVKYGPLNGEAYAEVAATRLFWALGFGAERLYPVRVLCQGCPSTIQGTDIASIERKMRGKDIETKSGSGWAWSELDLVDSRLGAPRAHRDALKLLAVLVQHTDSKPEQQRLLCLGEEPKVDDNRLCAETFMMVHDLGLTFGHATAYNRALVSSVNYDEWSGTPIWKDEIGRAHV